MIKKGKHTIKSHMVLEYSFSGIRLQHGILSPVVWDLSVDLVATGRKNTPTAELEYDASIAFQKVHFWLDTNLPNIIAVNVNDEQDLFIASMSSNVMMHCPDNPTDDLIIQLLHSKMSTLAHPELVVGEMRLTGSDTSLHYTFDVDGPYSLPQTTAEYYVERETRDKEPWWMRNDGFCFEFERLADSKLSNEELFGDINDPLDDFHRVMSEVVDMHVDMVKEPAKIVQVEKWKPKTI